MPSRSTAQSAKAEVSAQNLLGLVAGKRLQIRNIRSRRSKPGLMPQYLKAVEAAATAGMARTEGAHLGSRSLTFEPQGERLADQLILPLAFASGISRLRTSKVTQHLLTNVGVLILRGSTSVDVRNDHADSGQRAGTGPESGARHGAGSTAGPISRVDGSSLSLALSAHASRPTPRL